LKDGGLKEILSLPCGWLSFFPAGKHLPAVLSELAKAKKKSWGRTLRSPALN